MVNISEADLERLNNDYTLASMSLSRIGDFLAKLKTKSTTCDLDGCEEPATVHIKHVGQYCEGDAEHYLTVIAKGGDNPEREPEPETIAKYVKAENAGDVLKVCPKCNMPHGHDATICDNCEFVLRPDKLREIYHRSNDSKQLTPYVLVWDSKMHPGNNEAIEASEGETDTLANWRKWLLDDIGFRLGQYAFVPIEEYLRDVANDATGGYTYHFDRPQSIWVFVAN